MTTTGPSTLVKAGGWGWDSVRVGSRRVRVRVELLPGKPVFEGLDHSAELEENRRAIETVQQNSESSAGADLGLLTSQMAYTGDPHVPAAGPTYTETGSNRKTVASSHTVTTVTIYRAASTEPHAEIVTPYRMRVTLEADNTPNTGAPAQPGLKEPESTALNRFRGRLTLVEEADVGELREHMPLSLTEPVPTTTAGAARLLPAPIRRPTPPSPARPGRCPSPGRRDPDGPGRGRCRTAVHLPRERHAPPRGHRHREHPHGRRPPPDEGVRPRFPLGDLGARKDPDDDTLAALLRTTRETGLTRLGTGSAQALEDGISSTAVTAFFPAPPSRTATRWRG
ncbi:hypothetical protein SHKM778_18790 [Streptomyces sp. KM77-8]|uniref:Uncharacterized protein n=1 Tax=Streptomyces haneummycinicus TaxID=3074435 RepID=A0AAT9HDP2_9ACTN